MHDIPEILHNKRFIILGGEGQLGKKFVELLKSHSIEFTSYDIDDVDIADESSLDDIFNSLRADYVINCAAYNLVDKAEIDRELAYYANTIGPKNIAQLSNKYDFIAVHYSTDYVFSGNKNDFYYETDAVEPINFYGETKLEGERLFLKHSKNSLVFRTSWVYSDGKQNFIHKLIEWSKSQEYLKVTFDEVSIPTSVSLLADATLKALASNLKGTYHLTASGYASRYEWAKEILRLLNIQKIILPATSVEFNLTARRPFFSAMSNSKLERTLKYKLPTWQSDLSNYINNSLFIKSLTKNI